MFNPFRGKGRLKNTASKTLLNQEFSTPPDPDVMVQTLNLYKTFQLGKLDVEILKDINVIIKKSEFVSIMGPSGSGKSTLLYLLGGLDQPSSGSIRINGLELASMTDFEQSIMRRQKVGFVFQFYNLIPNLSVEENTLLPILLDGKKLKDHQKRLDDILDIVGLSDRKHHTPRELSGGQQQRVAIARALINEPDLILADEPIGNLDSKTGTDIMELLRTINKEHGKNIIQVTHSTEAAEYGNRTIHVRDGRIWA